MSELFTPYPGDRCSICGVKDDRSSLVLCRYCGKWHCWDCSVKHEWWVKNMKVYN